MRLLKVFLLFFALGVIIGLGQFILVKQSDASASAPAAIVFRCCPNLYKGETLYPATNKLDAAVYHGSDVNAENYAYVHKNECLVVVFQQ